MAGTEIPPDFWANRKIFAADGAISCAVPKSAIRHR
jgi:hypothetical protein